MNTEQMRAALISVYSGAAWKNKVKKMPEDQVQAVYLRLKSQGRVN